MKIKYNNISFYNEYVNHVEIGGWTSFRDYVFTRQDDGSAYFSYIKHLLSNTSYFGLNLLGSNVVNYSIDPRLDEVSIKASLNEISLLTGLSFEQVSVGDVTHPLINYSYNNSYGPTDGGATDYVGKSADSGTPFLFDGFSSASLFLGPVSEMRIVIHETLHTLGLHHPGGFNGFDVYGEMFGDDTFGTNLSHLSVMYNVKWNVPGQSLMGPADLEALWRKFHTPFKLFAEGDTEYNVEGIFKNHNLVDSDGVDVLKVGDSASGFGHIVNMEMGGLSTLVYGSFAYSWETHVTIMDRVVDKSGVEIFSGTVLEDLISGNGHDVVYGNDVDNEISMGSGNDTVYGYGGNDYIFGEAGHDLIYGDNILEEWSIAPGYDVLDGGFGNDTLYGGDGFDVVYGDRDRDELYGGSGNDWLYGGTHNDKIFGGSGWDVMFGGDGVDTLEGESGKDVLHGDAGNDRLFGGDDDDEIYAGEGNDNADGGQGNDWIEGGQGDDILRGGDGRDNLYGGEDFDRLYGGLMDDALYGGWGLDHLYGDAGNDNLFGGEGDDSLFGGAGNDMLVGGSGTDIMTGGGGTDRFVFTREGHDVITDFSMVHDRILIIGKEEDFTILGSESHTMFVFNGSLGTPTVLLEGVPFDPNNSLSDFYQIMTFTTASAFAAAWPDAV